MAIHLFPASTRPAMIGGSVKPPAYLKDYPLYSRRKQDFCGYVAPLNGFFGDHRM